MAPDFALTTFDGQPLTLAELKGKVVVVNFWATWCLRDEEASDLEQAWRDYQDKGVQFVGIDYLDQSPLNQQYWTATTSPTPTRRTSRPGLPGLRRARPARNLRHRPKRRCAQSVYRRHERDDLAFESIRFLAEKS